jgi:hypothetical protein
VEIRCPNCDHQHRRCIKDGQILEQGRHSSPSKEIIRPLKSTYSKQPLTEKMREAQESNRSARDGECVSHEMFNRWLEVAARERGQTE